MLIVHGRRAQPASALGTLPLVRSSVSVHSALALSRLAMNLWLCILPALQSAASETFAVGPDGAPERIDPDGVVQLASLAGQPRGPMRMAFHEDVPCIDKKAEHVKMVNYTGNVSRKGKFRRREGLSCYSKGPCFRAVYDHFASEGAIAEIEANAPSIENSPHGYEIKMWTWSIPLGYHAWNALAEDVRQLLIEKHDVPPSVKFYRTNIIRANTKHSPPYYHNQPHPQPWKPVGLHGDFLTDMLFVYTAILYLCTHGEDGLEGGETGIGDEVGADRLVSRGLRIEPSRGRLLVFSSGVENMHAALPILNGTRLVTQLWYACEGMRSGWATPLPDDAGILDLPDPAATDGPAAKPQSQG